MCVCLEPERKVCGGGVGEKKREWDYYHHSDLGLGDLGSTFIYSLACLFSDSYYLYKLLSLSSGLNAAQLGFFSAEFCAC